MAGLLAGLPAVLGEERLLEARLAAQEVRHAKAGRRLNDGRDRAEDPQPQRVVLDLDVADAGQLLELGGGRVAREAKLDLVMGQIAQRVHAIDPNDAAFTDDRDAVAAALDFTEYVAGKEDRAAVGDSLPHHFEEGLLDERIETGRRLVEKQQLRPVLQRRDQTDLLLVAL